MQKEDIEEVAALEAKNFSQPWSAEGIEDYFSSGKALFIVAKTDGKLAGYAAITMVLDEGNIVSIVVDEEYRRCGIATGLLELTEDELVNEGAKTLYLEVRKSNDAAINFYLKEGFAKVGERKNFYERPKEDALILEKALRAFK